MKDFLDGRSIRVRIGKETSDSYLVENGKMGKWETSVLLALLLFTIMINYVFLDVGPGIGKLLFADDGALWKRGRNIKYTVRKVQEAIGWVEQWSTHAL